MTSPIIQIPYLRPENVREEPGFGATAAAGLGNVAKLLAARQERDMMIQQQQEQLNQQALAERGRLALEQEKFDAEESQRKDQKKQREAAIAALNAHFGIQQPEPKGKGAAAGAAPGQQPAQAGAAPGPGGEQQPQGGGIGDIAAGGPAFIEMFRQLNSVARDQAENEAIGGLLDRAGDAFRSDPKVRAATLGHIVAINPEKAKLVDQASPFAKPDIHSLGQGTQLVNVSPTGGAQVVATGLPKEGTVSTMDRIKFAGRQGLLAVRDAFKAIRQDDNADAVPWQAEIGRMVAHKLGDQQGGQEVFTQNLTPTQKAYDRALQQVAHSISSLYGGQRSQYIFQSVLNSYRPGAGRSDKETRTTYRASLAELRESLAKLEQGDMAALSSIKGLTADDVASLQVPGSPPENMGKPSGTTYHPENPFAK